MAEYPLPRDIAEHVPAVLWSTAFAVSVCSCQFLCRFPGESENGIAVDAQCEHVKSSHDSADNIDTEVEQLLNLMSA